MTTEGKYVFDNAALLMKCYELLSILFGNKEFSRRIDPEKRDCTLSVLQSKYFQTSVTRLLIEIAATVRVMQDQIKLLPEGSDDKQKYERRLKIVDGYYFDEFEASFDLRKTCNKIIHADTFKLMTREGNDVHENDYACRAGDIEKSINWKYIYEAVSLGSKNMKGDKQWAMLLNIEVFAKAVYDLWDWSKPLA